VVVCPGYCKAISEEEPVYGIPLETFIFEMQNKAKESFNSIAGRLQAGIRTGLPRLSQDVLGIIRHFVMPDMFFGSIY
jgi:hypothetical protein